MNHPTRTILRAGAIAASAAVCATLAIAGPAQAAVVTDTSALRDAVTVGGVKTHLDGVPGASPTRTATTAPPARRATTHPSTTSRVCCRMRATTPWRQEFTYERTNFGDSALAADHARPRRDYMLGVDFFPMDFSGEGDVTAPVTAVDVNLAGDHATDERLRGGGLRRLPRRQHRAHPARLVRLLGEGRQRDRRRRRRRRHLQPGQRGAGRRPARPVRRHARRARAVDPRRQRAVRARRRVGDHAGSRAAAQPRGRRSCR